MKTYIVTEAPCGETILQRILNTVASKNDFSVGNGGGRSSAVTLAMTLLGTRQSPVALVVDADSSDDARIVEERVTLQSLLASAGAASRFRLVLAVPEIEILLFPDRDTASQIFGRHLTDVEWTQAQFQPRKMANQLLINNGKTRTIEQMIVRLSRRILQRLAEQPLIEELRQFILADAAVTALS
jgi:signal transduction histidine kinase